MQIIHFSEVVVWDFSKITAPVTLTARTGLMPFPHEMRTVNQPCAFTT